jgi:medium-chain acyl-[acyl-carrier-protein] hydrolase
VPIESRGLAAMDDEALVEELRGYGGTPDELLQHRELMDLMLPIVRADFSIHESYTHTDGPPLAAPISAFGGLDDREVGREHLEAWGELTTGAFRLCMLPGDHFYLLRDRPSLLRAVLHDLAPRLAGG